MPARKLSPIHPGEVLVGAFLEPLGISQYRLAKDISVPARRINEIVHGTRAISYGSLTQGAFDVARSDLDCVVVVRRDHQLGLTVARPSTAFEGDTIPLALTCPPRTHAKTYGWRPRVPGSHISSAPLG